MTPAVDEQTIARIIAAHPALRGVDAVRVLDKGYSQERKYILWRAGAPRWVVRLGGSRARAEAQSGAMARCRALGVRCPEPVAAGADEASGDAYLVLTYLPGDEAREVLPGLPEARQYAIGLEAGEDLRRITSIARPDETRDWAAHREAKYRRLLGAAHDDGITFPGLDRAEAYVDAHLGRMADRPVRLQHDDFHPGNLIVRDGAYVGVIDFNRMDWGDPWHEFYKLPWFAVPFSVPYARGQVHGCFGGEPPAAFWPTYTLYLGMNLRPSLAWAARYTPQGLPFFHERIADILATHDFADGGPPAWYDDRR